MHVVEELPVKTDRTWLVLYVVYRDPSDFPGMYVVRKHGVFGTVDGSGVAVERRPVAVCLTLESARKYVPPGLVNIGRQTSDDPVIVESWV